MNTKKINEGVTMFAMPHQKGVGERDDRTDIGNEEEGDRVGRAGSEGKKERNKERKKERKKEKQRKI